MILLPQAKCPICKVNLEIETIPYALNVCLHCGNTCWTDRDKDYLVNSETELSENERC